ncbi:SagB/ThcOx family dehydrogenase [Desulfococcaceae bacterium HSG9]|nr:SagB/ThcOx family dehydrogenase [Desulfococcaceae bacterium HSG9]
MAFKKERRKFVTGLGSWAVGLWLASSRPQRQALAQSNKQCKGAVMKLPPVTMEGMISVEQAIKQRRTVRSYKPKMLHLEQLTKLLWSAQGVTDESRFKRAVPSAGALYPMDIYTVAGQDSVEQINAGVYHYESKKHLLTQVTAQDLRDEVAKAALFQTWMAEAPLNFVITAEYSRVTSKYGKRGVRYARIEAGHIGQNLFLQAEALGLKAGIVGAFHDKKLIDVMKIPRTHEPLLIMPVGYAA